jgi:hypothetical protein
MTLAKRIFNTCNILWEFDILPSPCIKWWSRVGCCTTPLNLKRQAPCNCYHQRMNPVCLVDLPPHWESTDMQIRWWRGTCDIDETEVLYPGLRCMSVCHQTN